MPSVATSGVRAMPELTAKLLALAGILLVALAFVYQYVVHYFLNYTTKQNSQRLRLTIGSCGVGWWCI
jgi:hypothetical protein